MIYRPLIQHLTFTLSISVEVNVKSAKVNAPMCQNDPQLWAFTLSINQALKKSGAGLSKERSGQQVIIPSFIFTQMVQGKNKISTAYLAIFSRLCASLRSLWFPKEIQRKRAEGHFPLVALRDIPNVGQDADGNLNGLSSSRQLATITGVSGDFARLFIANKGVATKATPLATGKADIVSHEHLEERKADVRALLKPQKDRFGMAIPERILSAFMSAEPKRQRARAREREGC